MITAFEQTAPKKITYKLGTCFVELTGVNASLYRAMVWQYGESAAAEKFWWLWHKKENSVLRQENAVQSL